MQKILIILAFSFALTSCAAVKDKIPKIERKACDGSSKTLADVLCKKN
tara:strand:- start:268 stop:411 length:144 start_codon:yes stop_codon:yes gene_type:complete